MNNHRFIMVDRVVNLILSHRNCGLWHWLYPSHWQCSWCLWNGPSQGCWMGWCINFLRFTTFTIFRGPTWYVTAKIVWFAFISLSKSLMSGSQRHLWLVISDTKPSIWERWIYEEKINLLWDLQSTRFSGSLLGYWTVLDVVLSKKIQDVLPELGV
jgi:hypothetical protein